jgi:hypothetical protein
VLPVRLARIEGTVIFREALEILILGVTTRFRLADVNALMTTDLFAGAGDPFTKNVALKILSGAEGLFESEGVSLVDGNSL